MFVAHLLNVLPGVLHATHLCSVRGCSIFHAYNWVCIQWLDCILDAIGFGVVLRHGVTTLHSQDSAFFMLHPLLPEMAVKFSICQGTRWPL
jgi:hypothetical protein